MSHPQPLKDDKEDDPPFFGTLAHAHAHAHGKKEGGKKHMKERIPSRAGDH